MKLVPTLQQRKLLVFSLYIIFFNSISAENVILSFPSFSLRNFTLLGDSFLRNGIVGLTRELGVPVSSSGTVIYNQPIKFFDPESNVTASFSTKFSFTVNNLNPGVFGDGFTFFISPDNETLGSFGGYLGLVNSTQLTKNRFVAVEFDTRQDSYFDDPNENHIGLDIDSLKSVRTADPVDQGIDLKSGNLINAWLDYKSDRKRFRVFVSYFDFKPPKPLLSVDVDLTEYLNSEGSYVCGVFWVYRREY